MTEISMASESDAMSQRFSDENLKRLRVYLRTKYIEPIRVEYKRWYEDLHVSYYDPGVSKRVSAHAMKQFADDRISEIARILRMDTSELQHVPTQPKKLWATYIQIKNNHKIYDGFVSIEVHETERGENKKDLVQVYGRYYAEPIINIPPRIGTDEAIMHAKKELVAFLKYLWRVRPPGEPVTEPKLVYYRKPETNDSLRLVYLIEFDEAKYFVDAENGRILGEHQKVVQ